MLSTPDKCQVPGFRYDHTENVKVKRNLMSDVKAAVSRQEGENLICSYTDQEIKSE